MPSIEVDPVTGTTSMPGTPPMAWWISSATWIYLRGTWEVPQRRRTRSRTISSGIVGSESYVETYDGGIIVSSDETEDIVYVEPPRSGDPTDPVYVAFTTTSGTVVYPSYKLLRGCYYIVTDDPKDGVVVSSPYPWASTPEHPHNPTAKAIFDEVRSAAIASGVPQLAGLPPLTGP